MKNGVAKLLSVITIITVIGSGVLVVLGLIDLDYNIAMLYAGIAGLISAVFVRGFAEIIELLQGIKDNTETKDAPASMPDELPDI